MASSARTALESSVLFIQQEHAKTLKALHEEIAKLQKKCTELSFQLTMGNLAFDDDSDHLQAMKLEQELMLEKKKGQDLEKDLSVKNSELDKMHRNFKALENEKEFELKMKTRQISSLELELENKAKTISDLMAELHSMKLKEAESKHAAAASVHADSSSFRKNLEKAASDETLVSVAGEKRTSPLPNKSEVLSSSGPTVSYLLRNKLKKSSVASSGSLVGSEDSFALTKDDLEKSSSSFSSKESLSSYSSKGRGSCAATPVPPKDAAPKLRRRTNVKTPVTASEKLNSDLLTKSPVVNRPLSNRRVNSAVEVIPDPSPFLTTTKSQLSTKPRPLSKKPKVLPPIPCRNSAQQSKDLACENRERTIKVETATLRQANEFSHPANSRMEKSAAVEVLALEKADQLEVRHAAKYNNTANCN